MSTQRDVVRKYNNVAQMRHFRGVPRGLKTCLTIFCAQIRAPTLPKSSPMKRFLFQQEEFVVPQSHLTCGHPTPSVTAEIPELLP
jgi:hypothetical protein